MSVKMPARERTSHPYYMYDMIKEIPAGLASTLKAVQAKEWGSPPTSIIFTGNGSALYAALMGASVPTGHPQNWRAAQAFELANYEPIRLNEMVVGISHSGITKSTVDAVSRAKQLGARTAGITHFLDRPISKVVDTTFVVGNGPDRSRCHTKTYVDSAAAVAELLLGRVVKNEASSQKLRDEFEKKLGQKLESTIQGTEKVARKAAEELGSLSKVFFAGAGPNYVTAREAALKVKETSYIPAEGMHLEEILHGSWLPFDRETLVAVAAPSGPSVERARNLVSASRKVGAMTLVVSDIDIGGDIAIRVPSTVESLSPFLTIIPLYFFAYFAALKRGSDPDVLRYTEQDYWDARQVIFPPGTH